MYNGSILLGVLGVLVVVMMVYGAVTRSKLIFVVGAALLIVGVLIFFAMQESTGITATI